MSRGKLLSSGKQKLTSKLVSPWIQGGDVPKQFWRNPQNVRRYTEWFATRLNIQTQSDWYTVSSKDFLLHNGKNLIYYFQKSPYKLLQIAYPEFTWNAWEFSAVPSKFWNDTQNHRKFFEYLSYECGLHTKDDWYGISKDDVIEYGGATMLYEHYGGSVYRALQSVYPEHTFDPWRFQRVPKEYWTSMLNQRRLFDRIADELNIECAEQWYLLKLTDFWSKGAQPVLQAYYEGNVNKALEVIYPEYLWNNRPFQQLKSGFWLSVSNQRKFMDWAATHFLGIKEKDDWYKVTTHRVTECGGRGLLAHYKNSLSKALQTIYPEHQWYPWLFESFPRNFFEVHENAVNFMTWLGDKLNIKNLEEWYFVPATVVHENGGYSLLKRHKNVLGILKFVYPDYPWTNEFSQLAEANQHEYPKSQAILRMRVREIMESIKASKKQQKSKSSSILAHSHTFVHKKRQKATKRTTQFKGGSKAVKFKFITKFVEYEMSKKRENKQHATP